ncbi:hypothetical protein [Williamwhitmania taraxaci]|uniref:GLPGLI family protein n=1 Tax=Williamwhitmania taraxaci TaxID=1640674 RepID=A0A1G6HPF8_9BACT|nr:hypothetical protein [Williamwhitmania taraxaci]SDB95386.1 hypothetical protein SAMN05216323_101213 [Williamwhitmania taraxaci]
MTKFINLLVLLLLSTGFHAQSDSLSSTVYTPDFSFNNGIYLTFAQVKNNNPIPKSRLIISENLSSPAFFDKVLGGKKIFFFDENGLRKEVLTEQIWGFSNNGVIYINLGGSFNKISIVGNLCHFIATVTVTNQQYYDPFYNGYGANYNISPNLYSIQETRQFLLNFKTGKVSDYTVPNVSTSIAADDELAKEYLNLSKRKKKDLKFLYIRRYNQCNPLLIPTKK